MTPPAEHVHWLFASAFLILGLALLTEALVGEEVWRRRPWRAYLWPGLMFTAGVFMWPVMVFFTNSTVHMLAHGAWAQVMMLAGGAHLGLVHGRLRSRYWELTMPLAFVVSGTAFLLHEQNGWLYSRSVFVHHACAWALILGAVFPLAKSLFPARVAAAKVAYGLTIVVLGMVLYTARDSAPIFGHYSGSAVLHR